MSVVMHEETIDPETTEIQELWKPKRYKYRLVAFIDILGWKETIQSEKVDRLFTVLEKLKEKILEETLLEKHFHETRQKSDDKKKIAEARLFVQKQDRQITLFSDSIIISYNGDKDNLQWSFHELIASIYELHEKLLEDGYLIRGAVTYDKLYHKNEKCFGPALVRAIGLEAACAGKPRVIFDKRITRRFKLRNFLDLTKNSLVVKHQDGFYAVNAFGRIQSIIELLDKPDIGTADETLRMYFWKYYRVISIGLKSKSVSHFLKHAWLAEIYIANYNAAKRHIKIESEWTGNLKLEIPKYQISKFKIMTYNIKEYFIKRHIRKMYLIENE
jgi:hypothetical protein